MEQNICMLFFMDFSVKNNEKLDNQLIYSLSTPENLRSKTDNLNVGYETDNNVWELIVKYVGDLSDGIDKAGLTGRVRVATLTGNYAVITIAQEDIERFADIDEVFFIERPTRLWFSLENARNTVCLYESENEKEIDDENGVEGYNSQEENVLGLTGEGVIVGIIDSGIDYFHPDFRNEDGTTRINRLWDQTTGVVYTREEINNALTLGRREGERIVSQRDISGHGTHVAGIACGNGRASMGRYRGIAWKSEIVVVKLGDSVGDSFPRTTRLLEALDFCVNVAIEENKPIAINLSFGNNYGTHSGDSLVVSYINNICRVWKTNVVIGTGNEGNSRRHTSGKLRGVNQEDSSVQTNTQDNTQNTTRNSMQLEEVEFNIGELEKNINLQIWRNYYDEFDIYLVFPDNSNIRLTGRDSFMYEYDKTTLLIYNSAPGPISGRVETFIEFIPRHGDYINNGIFKIYMVPINIVTGEYNMWFPVGGILNENTGFINSVADTTITIPATSSLAISVGAYDSINSAFAEFSGRGPIAGGGYSKPDLIAPGVDIVSCDINNSYSLRSGTSMATPFVTGAAALLMEYGIVRDNDEFLYGQKLKTYLLKGARQLSGEVTPSYKTGYGALCVAESIPRG